MGPLLRRRAGSALHELSVRRLTPEGRDHERRTTPRAFVVGQKSPAVGKSEASGHASRQRAKGAGAFTVTMLRHLPGYEWAARKAQPAIASPAMSVTPPHSSRASRRTVNLRLSSISPAEESRKVISPRSASSRPARYQASSSTFRSLRFSSSPGSSRSMLHDLGAGSARLIAMWLRRPCAYRRQALPLDR